MVSPDKRTMLTMREFDALKLLRTVAVTVGDPTFPPAREEDLTSPSGREIVHALAARRHD